VHVARLDAGLDERHVGLVVGRRADELHLAQHVERAVEPAQRAARLEQLVARGGHGAHAHLAHHLQHLKAALELARLRWSQG
jgi:hypothetical protein